MMGEGRFLYLTLSFVTIASSFVATFASTAGAEWNYREYGPSTWGTNYEECSADSQSPILLNKDHSDITPEWVLQSQGIKISFLNYNIAGNTVFSNNGHSVNLAFNYSDSANAPRVVISKPRYSSPYYLQALHFHWQSEHWVNNRNYPLEMHMVHSSEDGETLVLGFVFVACERQAFRWLRSSPEGLDAVAKAVRSLTQVGNSVELGRFAPQRLMPSTDKACGYFAYSGSLTTPPCTEGVTWLVREAPLCAEDWQLQTFYSVRDSSNLLMAGNARPLQNRNDRSVLYLSC